MPVILTSNSATFRPTRAQLFGKAYAAYLASCSPDHAHTTMARTAAEYLFDFSLSLPSRVFHSLINLGFVVTHMPDRPL